MYTQYQNTLTCQMLEEVRILKPFFH